VTTETHWLRDDTATEQLGATLAGRVPSGVVWLQGDLGAGKTTLVRGWLRALGHVGAVKSPTYTIVEPYQLNGMAVYHFDLYRLTDPEELEMIGGRDYFDHDALCLVEWPQRAGAALPAPTLTVTLAPAMGGREALLTFAESGPA
jgi:tRNA threonylcarbamoyladenosine biosynthesis protein TsaE